MEEKNPTIEETSSEHAFVNPYEDFDPKAIERYIRMMSMKQSPNPVFIPNKHTKMSYAAQNRASKKRRNSKK